MKSSQTSYRRKGRGGSNPAAGNNGRTYSNSSGGSNEKYSLPISMLKPSSGTQDRANTARRVLHTPAGDNPLQTQTRHQQSSWDGNGNHHNQTYTSHSSSSSSPSQSTMHPSPSPSPISRPLQRGHSPGHSSTAHRPAVKPLKTHWAYRQEAKIKILGLPASKWTKDVYEATSSFGNVVRIEMQLGQRGTNNAWVVFRPPPFKPLPNNLRIKVDRSSLAYHICQPIVNSIPSPVDQSRSYYEFTILPAKLMSFGVRTADTAMIAMKTVQSCNRDRIYMTLNLQRKELDIQFPLSMDTWTQKFRFSLPFALLSHIYKVPDKDNHGHTNLIIPFDLPPRFFKERRDEEVLEDGSLFVQFSKKDKIWSCWDSWFRETDIVEGVTREELRISPLMNHKEKAIIDLGRWTTYQICFENATLSGEKFEEFRNALADHGVVIQDLDRYDIEARKPAAIWSLLQDEKTYPYNDSSKTDSVFDDLFATRFHLEFPVRYQLEACLSHGYLKDHSMTREFLTKLAMMEPRSAVYLLEKIVDKQHVYYDPMDIFNIKIRGSLERNVPKYCVLQRSVIVTPTMLYVASPVLETSNRIVRKYAADVDQFIRVKFSDEKTEGVLRNMPNKRADAVFSRVRRAMTNGIVVAGRCYEFLAFGNSQFRENGAYFYAPTTSNSAEDIRRSLGKFDHIKSIAKYGARLGQCFSTTRAMGITVSRHDIPDIERNGFNFTDGVGKLSLFLAQMAAQELGLSSPFENPPSLFQFRLGGCKGVFTLDPNISRNEVHIRPSQHKFDAPYTGLEIIRSSALATPFFNRQVIMVLSNLGVPDHVFIRKQQEMVTDYENAMSDEDVAVEKLRKHIDINQITLTMAGMVLDGFMQSREPFLMSLLMLWRSHTIKNLKEKARIAIEDGAFVLGCVDETATLKGHKNDPQSRADATREEKLATLPEIFLQIDDTARPGHYKIIEQICVLARNPSLHPGDIRVVRAVNTPALHHLKNVVVFPQTGDRDLANMCSGGDLDGDDYMVLWDSQLIPQTINEPPMDFTPEKPIELDRPITVRDISDFFVTYMKNESLGQIAHAHLAQADMKANGVNDHTCLELAKLHSQAVDYPKSGIPAVMDQALRAPKYPHFMEKKHLAAKKTYQSKKILGMLYDQVQLIDFLPQWENKFDKRILEAYELEESLLQKAREIKIAYDEGLRRLMAKHGIGTEFEAWSVFVLAHNHESRDYKFSEEFGRTVSALKAQYREMCRESAEVTSVTDWERLGPFVAAMYTVTAREMELALSECRATKTVAGNEVPVRKMSQEHMPLISFPWLFASELGKIAIDPDLANRKKSHRINKPGDHSELQAGDTKTKALTSNYGGPVSPDLGSMASMRELEISSQIGQIKVAKPERESQSSSAMTLEQGFPIAHYVQPSASTEADKSEPLIPHAMGSKQANAILPITAGAPSAPISESRSYENEGNARRTPSDDHDQFGGESFPMPLNTGSGDDPVMHVGTIDQDITLEMNNSSAFDELMRRFGTG